MGELIVARRPGGQQVAATGVELPVQAAEELDGVGGEHRVEAFVDRPVISMPAVSAMCPSRETFSTIRKASVLALEGYARAQGGQQPRQ